MIFTETPFLRYWRAISAWRAARGQPALFYGEARRSWLALSLAWRR